VLELTEKHSGTGAVGLPDAVGPISELVLATLARPASGGAPRLGEEVGLLATGSSRPLEGDDLQLALYLCYELHYRSFAGVDPGWEWSPDLLAARAELESTFFGSLEQEVGPVPAIEPEAIGDELFRLESEDDGPSLSRVLESNADLDRFREFVVHRSLYQLKEADPHSWAIPRLTGAPKSALLEVQSDEYGGGRPDRIHSGLFAKTMRSLGLDDRENAYLDRAPGITLATVNLMTGCGLHRSRRGAIVGHLAMFEMTSSRPNRRYGNAMRRLGFDREATDFYDEHVEADAVHENIAAYDLAGGLALAEPEVAEDILFGARALLHLDGLFAAHLLGSWDRGQSSLRRPL
jgi:hypothetical protein